MGQERPSFDRLLDDYRKAWEVINYAESVIEKLSPAGLSDKASDELMMLLATINYDKRDLHAPRWYRSL